MTQNKAQKITLTYPSEPILLWCMKAFAHLAAVFLYLVFLTSPWALFGALGASLLALFITHKVKVEFSSIGLFTVGGSGILIAYLLSTFIESSTWISTLLGANIALRTSDTLFFIFVFLALSSAMRLWSKQSRVGSLVEGAFVLVAVIQLFAAHRDGQIHEPRFFTDWVLIGGHAQIHWWLRVFGVAITLLFLLSMTKVRRNLHFIIAFVFLLVQAYLFSQLYQPSKPQKVIEPYTLGGGQGDKGDDDKNGKEGDEDQSGQGDGSGQGQSQSPQKPPVPVAVAIFHDDYLPENGVYYFRQQVLSRFDGVKLVSDDTGDFDQDVLTDFPHDQNLNAQNTQVEAAHILLPTSMLLLDEHPTPPMLTHGVQVKTMDNPDPQRFVAAYDVISRIPAVPLIRHLGKASIPSQWNEKYKRHYLATHDKDPRYQSLAAEITSELPSSWMADPLRKAIAIKRYLEQAGHYSLKVKHRSRKDPAASFLFGSLKGYCVHFAHSAVHLLRSQGIAARVALGYAVNARTRSNSSAVVITGDRAHAWPEIHIAGVGWVTFDIYPEHSDEPPPRTVSQSMESLFGEIARDQNQRGLTPKFTIPWQQIIHYASYGVLGLLLLAYLMNITRYLRLWWASDEQIGKWAYLVTLDRLAGAGVRRRYGESREAFAQRAAVNCPTFISLTEAHLAWAWGAPMTMTSTLGESSSIKSNDVHIENKKIDIMKLNDDVSSQHIKLHTVRHLSKQTRREYAKNHRIRWILSHLNPFSFYLSR